MKKILLLIVCCLCLCGCNNKNDNFNNPNIDFVKNKIEKIEGVSEICVVTEANDPNGQLNKDKGYTGALYFSLDTIETSTDDVDADACEKGTSAGGSIEVYANESDAKKRNDYLSSFDGGIFASYHTIKGTVVIRLSEELTATQQEELSNEIISNLKNAN